MKDKTLSLVTAIVLFVCAYVLPAAAQTAAEPTKPDKEQVDKPARSNDTTTPSPVEPTRSEKPDSAMDPKKPKTPNSGETAPADVSPSKPGAADQTK